MSIHITFYIPIHTVLFTCLLVSPDNFAAVRLTTLNRNENFDQSKYLMWPKAWKKMAEAGFVSLM